jgi:hypothetical protein
MIREIMIREASSMITKQIAPGVYEARHGQVVAYAEFMSVAMILAWRMSCAST